MTQFNTIAIKNLASLNLPKINSVEKVISSEDISVFNLDIATLGYTLSSDVCEALHYVSYAEFNALTKSTYNVLCELTGANKVHVPLFKKYPYHVEDPKKYFNLRVEEFFKQGKKSLRVPHELLSCGHAINKSKFNLDNFGGCPICQRAVPELRTPSKDYPPLEELTELKILSLSQDKDIFNLFKKIVNSKTSISPNQADVIKTVIMEKGSDIKGLLPREIFIKEIAALVSACLIKYASNVNKYLDSYNKTATDILRFATACSDGDISLNGEVVFKLKNKEKKAVMRLLNNIVSSPLEDLKKYRSKWLVLSQMLHINAYEDQYKQALAYIEILRFRESEIKTFESGVESMYSMMHQGGSVLKNPKPETQMADAFNALIDKSNVTFEMPKEKRINQDNIVESIVNELSSRPSMFGRRLDSLLRNSSKANQQKIVDGFKHVVGDVSTSILLSLKKHFELRNSRNKRLFFPKGSAALMKERSVPKMVIDTVLMDSLKDSINEALMARFSQKEHFKNVYIDKDISKIMVPNGMRSSVKGVKELTRGSRIKIKGDTDVIRFFAHWCDEMNGSELISTVDLDLSAVIMDENFHIVKTIYFNNHDENDSFYSGDLQSGNGSNGAFEAIDIKMDTMKNYGRYVAMCLNSYSGQAFSKFVASAGFMERTDLGKKGGAFEPSTVSNRFNLNSKGNAGIPLLVDLETREIIWIDVQKSVGLFTSVSTKSSEIIDTINSFVNFNQYKLNMFELIMLHSGRFENIDNEKKVDKKYDLVIDEDFVMDYAEIMENWM